MTNKDDRDDGTGQYASPPCFLHELDPAYMGLTPEPDLQKQSDVMRGRKTRRKRVTTAPRTE
ncbi:MAG: hypothetical protein Q7N95_13185 [Alphaproteobacteria bacterium]|nr:hypothetical protein [Alphaproteobacteria bacterium]